MIRLLPNPWLGLHPVLPQYPEPAEANYDLSFSLRTSVFLGCLHGAGRYMAGRPMPGCVLKTTAIAFPCIFAVRLAISQYQARKVWYPFFHSQGIKVPTRVLFQQSQTTTADDFFLGGAAAGALFSLWPHGMPGVQGWQRFVGASLFGAFAAGWLFAQFSPRYQAALAADQQAREDAVIISEKLALGYSLARAQTFLRLRQFTAGLRAYPTDDLVFPRMNNTHYQFAPESLEYGLSVLQQDKADAAALEAQKRDVASYIWTLLAEREAQFYAETDPDAKTLQRKALEALSTLHANTCNTVAFARQTQERDEKMMAQLRARYAGEKAWVPVTERRLEQEGINEVKQVLGHMYAVRTVQGEELAVMEQRVLGASEGEREELLMRVEEMRLSVRATDQLVLDLEARLQAIVDKLALDAGRT